MSASAVVVWVIAAAVVVFVVVTMTRSKGSRQTFRTLLLGQRRKRTRDDDRP